MKKRILVFPCGSEIGLEIYRSISDSIHFELFGGSSTKDHGSFVYDNYIEDIPHVDEHDFLDRLNDVIVHNNIGYIYPAHDSVLVKLAKMRDDGSLKCKLIASDYTTCKITRSKLETYSHFKGVLRTPKVFEVHNKITTKDLPIFMKPDIGQGSKGAIKISNEDELRYYYQKGKGMIFLEYLPGKEYTVDCFTNKNGKLIFSRGRERRRVSNGISVNSVKVQINSKFEKMAKIINNNLKFRGCWFFQVKEDENGQLCLLEIAPRVAGTMALSRCMGVNLPMLTLFDFEDIDVEIFENKFGLEIDRALGNKYRQDINYKNVYVDFDDTIINDGKINIKMISFIFQCINNNKKIYLITKHKGSLKEKLRYYKLGKIFDDIIWIKDDDNKHSFITNKHSILIDDSFSERKSVHDRLGIPVFDTHMIEALID